LSNDEYKEAIADRKALNKKPVAAASSPR
jgi:hypothetical protein